MTLTYREMQCSEFSGLFRLEFAAQYLTHPTLNDLRIFVMGKPCQKI